MSDFQSTTLQRAESNVTRGLFLPIKGTEWECVTKIQDGSDMFAVGAVKDANVEINDELVQSGDEHFVCLNGPGGEQADLLKRGGLDHYPIISLDENKECRMICSAGRLRIHHGTCVIELSVDNADLTPCVLAWWDDTIVDITYRQVSRKPVCPQIGAELYGSRKFCDVAIICKDRQFEVHRAVLASRSPTFEAMLHSKMQEATTSKIHITDVAPEAIELMLHYMYKGELPESYDSSHLADAFQLACKYLVPGLAQTIGSDMISSICSDNAKEYAEVLRHHAAAGNEDAKEVWNRYFKTLLLDPIKVQALVEDIIDNQSAPHSKRRRTD